MLAQTLEYPSIVALIEANAALTRQLEAKDKRIRHLEYVLEQRTIWTAQKYNPASLERMARLCYEVFLKNPGKGYTYEEFEDAFADHTSFRSANTGQRLRDLRKQGLIWSDGDPVKFYLKLAEAKA